MNAPSANNVLAQPTVTVVIYLRVSSMGQVNKAYDPEGYSIPGQREACQRYAESLGATVIREYVEPGKTGTNKNRPVLQRMLAELNHLKPTFVIFYDLSRAARDEMDALWLLQEIQEVHGCKLESTQERIDDTPAGKLHYVIMAGVNAFRSRNDAIKVRSGTEQKLQAGGTPGRASIGYINTVERVDERQVRTVAIDEERAPLVRLAFVLYATGQYSLIDLAAVLEGHGLRSRPWPGRQPNRCPLRNPYYIGVVEYGGKRYQGRHEPLIDEITFQQVQELLDTRRQSGERSWRNHNYLRGTLYCAGCGGRLFFTRVRGNTGAYYDYFVCRGRQQHTCLQNNHSVEAVEAKIAELYGMVTLPVERRDAIRNKIHDHVDKVSAAAAGELREAKLTQERLAREEAKLLAAHYADRISDALFSAETERIARERAAALQLVASLETPYEEALDDLRHRT